MEALLFQQERTTLFLSPSSVMPYDTRRRIDIAHLVTPGEEADKAILNSSTTSEFLSLCGPRLCFTFRKLKMYALCE